MSFRDCLTRAALRGAITEGKAKEALALLDELERDLVAAGVPEGQVAGQASQKATEEMARLALRKKQLAVLSYSAKQRVDANLQSYRDGNGNISYAKAAKAMIENDGFAPFESFASKKKVYVGRYHAMLQGFIEKYGARGVNVIRHTDGLDNIGRELFGEDTGDAAAKSLAKAISDTFEATRTTANSLGADIGKKERYGLPQHHNTLKVARAGKKAWIEFVLPRLDFSLMRDASGRSMTNLSPDERLEFLGKVWETVKSNGYVKAGDAKGRAALANRLGQQRFLEFKDFNAWKEYNGEFGDGDVFSTVINHVDSMSQNIAMLDIFGPNPHAMKQYISNAVMRDAGMADAAETGPVKNFVNWADHAKILGGFDEMWSVATGQNGIATNDYLGFTFAGLRNLLVSAKLAGATLAAVPGDMVTVRMAKAVSKLPSSDFTRQYIRLLKNSGERQLAVRMGLIAEAATSIASSQYRYMGDVFGPAWTRRVSDFVMRANLMTAHTQAARWAHGMEWLGYFADARAKAFDDLEVVDALKRHGITPEDWATFKRAPLYEHEGATFLRPDDLLTMEGMPAEKARNVADKFMGFVMEEMVRAVPDATIRARSILTGNTRPGTLAGELSRSFAMFKNFPVTLTMLLYRNMMVQQGLRSRASFAATYGLMLTAVGGLTVQLQQLAKGRDPINMNPASKHGRAFWGQAALTGGGLGIWGDFLFRDVNRFGGGATTTAAGPLVDFLGQTLKLTAGNALELAQGKDTNFAPELLQYTRMNMPGSNLWYGRLVLQNGIFDAIQKEIDPDYMTKWRRQQSSYMRDYGQKTWWGHGSFTPQRAPDLGAAVNE